MSYNSYEKGKELEDLVEYYLKLSGKRFERNLRIRGFSGALHEVDFLVYLRDGRKEVIEVKNMDKPVNKDVVMKVAEVANDVGAFKGVIVSSSGFTKGAIYMAKVLNVSLMDSEEIIRSIKILTESKTFLSIKPAYSLDEARRYAKKFLKRRFLLFNKENVGEVNCIFVPFYLVSLRMFKKRKTFREYFDLSVIFSAQSGLPLYRRKNSVVEIGEEISLLPLDLLALIGEYQGRKICKDEFLIGHPETLWRRFVKIVTAVGLGKSLKIERKTCIYLKEVIPDLKGLRADTIIPCKNIKAFATENGCKKVEARISPGTAKLVAELLLNASITNVKTIFLPIYKVKICSKDVKYRYIYLAAWNKKPLEFKPIEDLLDI